MKEHIELIDGREFKVTTLPRDTRLQPARTRKRQLFNSLSGVEKRNIINESKKAAAKKRKRRRRRKASS